MESYIAKHPWCANHHIQIVISKKMITNDNNFVCKFDSTLNDGCFFLSALEVAWLNRPI